MLLFPAPSHWNLFQNSLTIWKQEFAGVQNALAHISRDEKDLWDSVEFLENRIDEVSAQGGSK